MCVLMRTLAEDMMIKENYKKVRSQIVELAPQRGLLDRSEKPAMIASISLGSAALLAAGAYFGIRALRNGSLEEKVEELAS